MSRSEETPRENQSQGVERVEATPSNCSFCGIRRGDEEIGATNPLLEKEFEIPFNTTDFIVFPDAAPIAPRHSLIVPQEHVLSFARLDSVLQRQAISIVAHLREQLLGPTCHVPYVFEHGSKEEDEVIGCGITHAHLHFLFVPIGTVASADHIDDFNRYPNLHEAWDVLGEDDYYLFGQANRKVRATVVEEAAELKCSMFLRKWFASHMNRPELADYQRYQTGESDDMLNEVYRTQRRLSNISSLNYE